LEEIERIVEESKGNYENAPKEEKEQFLKDQEKQGKKIVNFVKLNNNPLNIDWQKESIIFPFLPKKHIQSFSKKSKIFMSKKVPLLIVADVKDHDLTIDNNDNSQPKLLFKYGDDLRQDNLVL